MKKIFGYLSKGIRILLTIVGGMAVSVMLFFFVRELWLALFYPVNLPINGQITDFEDIAFSSNPKCNGTANLENSVDYPFQLKLSDIPSNTQSYKVEALEPFIFDLAFNQSEFEILFTGDETPDNVAASIAEDFKRFQGTAGSISIDLSQVKKIDMIEAMCSPIVHLFNSSSNYYSAWVSYVPGSHNAIRTVQEIPEDSALRIILDGPITLKDYPGKLIKQISINLKTGVDISKVFVGIEGYALSTDLPNIIAVFDDKTDTRSIPFGNSFSIDSFEITNIEITAPVGKVQFGSYPEIALTDPFTSFSDIKLELPTLPYQSFSAEFRYLTFESNLPQGIVTINGTTSELIYRKQKYGISQWQMLPSYVQAGIFGLLLGAIPVGWTILKKRLPGKKVEKLMIEEYQPTTGDFICVLVSGYLISGKLAKQPGLFSSYYVIREAHRKHKNDATWELETIKEINIKASSIEQHYIKGQ